jgi:hypothetical protein
MTERTTETDITFAHAFILRTSMRPLEAGTYRLVVDEEQIEGVSFPAFRKVAAHLQLPALGTATDKRQSLPVSLQEIDAALVKDRETAPPVD